MRPVALIVAAGKGERFGETIPKQHQKVKGKTLLQWAVESFLHYMPVQVVIATDDSYYNFPDLPSPIIGGKTRQESVKLGLVALDGYTHVFIHDAARPFVDNRVMNEMLHALKTNDGVAPALPIHDSLFRPGDGPVTRDNLYRIQTPQAFDYTKILTAHQNTEKSYSDDISLAHAQGLKLSFVKGEKSMDKITEKSDLKSMMPEYRVGQGFDVHAFEEGDFVMLCGVKIPHDKALKGHSDADVGLHALCDALYGAMGAGDIGTHFPPTDEQWRGKDSAYFLKHAMAMLSEQGGTLVNCDVTFICETPKLTLYRDAMVKRLSELLKTDKTRINVKATTSERLGFTGRKEGIAAMTSVMCRF